MRQINLSILLLLLPALLMLAGCKRLTTTQGAVIDNNRALSRPIQISAPGIDAAEPVTASAADGTFYVAWVNHDAKQADVMIARFSVDGEMPSAPVRVN